MANRACSYWRKRRDAICNVDLCANLDSFVPDDVGNCLLDQIMCEDGVGESVGCEFDEVSPTINEKHDDIDDVDVTSTSRCFNPDTSEEYSSSASDEERYCDDNLNQQLAEWAVEFNITHTALGRLLHILHIHHPVLPLEPRTLLQSKRDILVTQLLSGGLYYHVGILNNVKRLYEAEPSAACFTDERLFIQFNVDGLPLHKSSSSQLWPILGILKGYPGEKPFTVGLYAGNHKPNDVHEYLAEFVAEAKQLQNGFVLGSGMHYLNIHSFVCDAPARSLLKQTKLHSGYSACERCTQKGVWNNKFIWEFRQY